MDDSLYDEFGNYIGPALESDEVSWFGQWGSRLSWPPLIFLEPPIGKKGEGGGGGGVCAVIVCAGGSCTASLQTLITRGQQLQRC